MTEAKAYPEIGPQRDWKDHAKPNGEYWHPVFWSPAVTHPGVEKNPEWFFERLDHFNLETQTAYLGDSIPPSHEMPLLARYHSGDKSAICDWVPQVGPKGTGWFILTLQDSDHGPFVVWARVREELPPGVHAIKDVN